MTLLEAVIAFVLLSVVGVVCLDQSRGASRLQYSSAEWSRAVNVGESAMAQAVAGVAAVGTEASAGGIRSDVDAVSVARLPYRNGLEIIEVRVPLQNGPAFVLTRLVPAERRSRQ
jgi:hypothetical protein